MIDREISMYSLNDILNTLKKVNDDPAYAFASELTGLSEDALWTMLQTDTKSSEATDEVLTADDDRQPENAEAEKDKIRMIEDIKDFRRMYKAMKEKLGDNPNASLRRHFILDWCRKYHNGVIVPLCVHTQAGTDSCEKCPIDWRRLGTPGDQSYGTCDAKYNRITQKGFHGDIATFALISEILALPLKEM